MHLFKKLICLSWHYDESILSLRYFTNTNDENENFVIGYILLLVIDIFHRLWYECIHVLYECDLCWHVYPSSGHSSYVTSVAFSTDGTKVVLGSYDKTVKIWNVESGDVMYTLHGEREYDDESVWVMMCLAYEYMKIDRYLVLKMN